MRRIFLASTFLIIRNGSLIFRAGKSKSSRGERIFLDLLQKSNFHPAQGGVFATGDCGGGTLIFLQCLCRPLLIKKKTRQQEQKGKKYRVDIYAVYKRFIQA